ncbi:MAG: hypothetical protein HY736_00880 [Verrucomicrobia bacterium]|nr:hypothetical protein [Verrucomicrobiota bacterium]
MSAKRSSKPTPEYSAPGAGPASAATAPAPATATEPGAHVAWMDSPDPRKRLAGQIAFVAVWIYVAALCLLALDQTFHWGIF